MFGQRAHQIGFQTADVGRFHHRDDLARGDHVAQALGHLTNHTGHPGSDACDAGRLVDRLSGCGHRRFQRGRRGGERGDAGLGGDFDGGNLGEADLLVLCDLRCRLLALLRFHQALLAQQALGFVDAVFRAPILGMRIDRTAVWPRECPARVVSPPTDRDQHGEGQDGRDGVSDSRAGDHGMAPVGGEGGRVSGRGNEAGPRPRAESRAICAR